MNLHNDILDVDFKNHFGIIPIYIKNNDIN
jgi:hypothetical protein